LSRLFRTPGAHVPGLHGPEECLSLRVGVRNNHGFLEDYPLPRREDPPLVANSPPEVTSVAPELLALPPEDQVGEGFRRHLVPAQAVGCCEMVRGFIHVPNVQNNGVPVNTKSKFVAGPSLHFRLQPQCPCGVL